MDRRNFLKTGGIALLGSLATGSAMALTTPGALGGEGADKKAAVALAMNHFGVSEAEETGAISVAYRGQFYLRLNAEELESLLTKEN